MRLCLDKLFNTLFFSFVVVDVAAVIKYSSCYVFCLCPLLKMLTHSIFSYCWVCETFHVLCKLFMLFRMNFHKHFNLIKRENEWERKNVDDNKNTKKSQQPDENFTCMVRNFTCSILFFLWFLFAVVSLQFRFFIILLFLFFFFCFYVCSIYLTLFCSHQQ